MDLALGSFSKEINGLLWFSRIGFRLSQRKLMDLLLVLKDRF
jgi:hypothetical protein